MSIDYMLLDTAPVPTIQITRYAIMITQDIKEVKNVFLNQRIGERIKCFNGGKYGSILTIAFFRILMHILSHSVLSVKS